MSTHATSESRDEPTAESTFEESADEAEVGPEAADADSGTSDEPAPMDPFEVHDAAATFGASTRRLPNTVDGENTYLG
ncbi:hypothetical protein I7X12_03945 [Halosimplex litoreum]|uniref:Uncharacterized protein n=1 Tax=Halosimplex litoreum TaxID=1198301 RepID=A0A7T3KVW8_9EURY|nr:hypothetical protein [Halosimplex litoreum]QPV63794.1 hypothetical protein I7X12_03945 [Halosimplex litoreum]